MANNSYRWAPWKRGHCVQGVQDMHHICLTHDADVLAGLHHPQPRTVLCIDPLINLRLFITDSIINYLTHSSESCRRFHSNLQTSFADSSSADGRETAALCLAIWPTTLTGEPREKGAIAFRGFKTYIYIYILISVCSRASWGLKPINTNYIGLILGISHDGVRWDRGPSNYPLICINIYILYIYIISFYINHTWKGPKRPQTVNDEFEKRLAGRPQGCRAWELRGCFSRRPWGWKSWKRKLQDILWTYPRPKKAPVYGLEILSYL